MAITLDKVTKYYGKQKVLNEISFTLNRGEICGFLGPNGAGKSTTMKIITGYLNDYTGNVELCGINTRQSPLQAKSLLGYLPEHNPLYPEMYIQEYLLYVARLYRIAHSQQKVRSIIELTGLMPEMGKKIGQLSKGYRQRVGLAQALVHNPEVLILDEPMTGLDPNQLEEIRHLIVEIGKDKTILLSTHIMQEVEAICDRVIIINEGSIITDKSIRDIRSLSGNSMTLLVQFATGSDTTWLLTSPLFTKTVQVSVDSWHLSANEGSDPRIEFFNQAALHQCPIIELKTESYNLEQVFHSLTQANK